MDRPPVSSFEHSDFVRASSFFAHLAPRLINIFAPKNEDYSLDLVGVREEFSRGFYGQLHCFQNWITVGAATDRRKRDGFDTVLDRDLQ